MVFAKPEHVEADAVGEFDLLEDVSEALVDMTGSPVAGSRRVSTKVYAPNCMSVLESARHLAAREA